MKPQNNQPSLFDSPSDQVASCLVDEKSGAGGNRRPTGSGKIKFDRDDLERQLKELTTARVKVKIDKHQQSAAHIIENDTGYVVVINPARWRGVNKTRFLENWIYKTVGDGFG